MGWPIAGEYLDEAVSGSTPVASWPQGKVMMALASSKQPTFGTPKQRIGLLPAPGNV